MTIKHDRDRFVAFAFAAADAFLEIDRAGTITYAHGALEWLAGAGAGALVDQKLDGHLDSRSQSLLNAGIEHLARAGRLGPLTLKFQIGNGKQRAVEAYGTSLPNYPDRVFLAFKAPSKLRQHVPSSPESTDHQTGLIKPEDFKQATAVLARASRNEGEKLDVSLVDVGGLQNKFKQLDDSAAAAFLEKIAAQLCAVSLDGSTAAQLSEQGFGVVHETGLDMDGVTQAVEALDEEGGLTVQHATVSLADGDLSQTDHVKALVYTISEFWKDPVAFSIGSIAEGHEALLADTKARMATFRKVVSDSLFDVLLQPVVELENGKVHHYEALARIKAKDTASSPYEFITFAEDAGVVGDFDIAMCRKVVDRINQAGEHGKQLAIAVNVSGRSLMSPKFVSQQMKLLEKCGDIRECLLFELTESTQIQDLESANQVLSELRKLGHHVCLDDFGAGAAGYQYLRALEVDYVKIDGVYFRESSSTEDGRTLLRSMADLCRDLGLSTIGEFVETAGQARFLRDIGVTHGQGYFFGKPSVGVKDVVAPNWF